MVCYEYILLIHICIDNRRLEQNKIRDSITNQTSLLKHRTVKSLEALKMEPFSQASMWFIQEENKKKWGNSVFMGILSLIAYIVYCVIVSVVYIYVSFNISCVISILVTILFYIFILRYKRVISPFYDEFHLLKELHLTLILVGIFIMVNIIYLVLIYLNVNIVLTGLLNTINVSYTYYVFIIINMFYYLNYYIRNNNNLASLHAYDLPVELNEFISHSEGYYLFMEYLVYECNVENLMFIAEVSHFKWKYNPKNIFNREREYSITNSIKKLKQKLVAKLSIADSKDTITTGNVTPIVPTKIWAKSDDVDIVSFPNGKNVSISPYMTPAPNPAINPALTLDNIDMSTPVTNTDDKNTEAQLKIAQISDESKVELAMKSSDDTSTVTTTVTATDTNKIKKVSSFGNILKVDNGYEDSFVSIPSVSDIIHANGLHKQKSVNLPKLPKTLTLTTSMKQENIYDCIILIYNNFIHVSGVHEINISHDERVRLNKLIKEQIHLLEEQSKILKKQH